MFAIATTSSTRVLLQGTPDELELVSCLYDEVKPLRIRTRRAAKAILHHNFTDIDDIAVRQVEAYAWKQSHRLESLPTEVIHNGSLDQALPRMRAKSPMCY